MSIPSFFSKPVARPRMRVSSLLGHNASCCDFKQLFPRLACVALHGGTGASCVPRFSEGPGSLYRVTPLGTQLCIRSIQSWIGTMMQSYASRVWLQSGGPIFQPAFGPWFAIGLPPPRIFMVGSKAIRIRPMNFGIAQFLNRRYVPNFRYNRGQIRERL